MRVKITLRLLDTRTDEPEPIRHQSLLQFTFTCCLGVHAIAVCVKGRGVARSASLIAVPHLVRGIRPSTPTWSLYYRVLPIRITRQFGLTTLSLRDHSMFHCSKHPFYLPPNLLRE